MFVNRRVLLWSVAAFAFRRPLRAKDDQVRRYRTANAEIEMSVEFHDGYASESFELGDALSGRRFHPSASGEQDGAPLSGFRGSLAIAHYRVRSRAERRGNLSLRESVRTIDRDKRLEDRLPFERAIVLDRGFGSDIQAFGYELAPGEEPIPDRHGPWYLFRQDLFLEPQPAPFLIVYWKHALGGIRALDIIPGEQTKVVTP